MKVRSMIRAKTDIDGNDKRPLEAEGTSWDDVIAQLDEQTPEGWIRLYVQVIPAEG